MSRNWYFPPYQSVADRRAKAAAVAAQLTKRGRGLSPVVITGRQMAHSFWGQAWCRHLESFSDFENRLPRGRSYARHGAVIDLKIMRGQIAAQIMGSQLYQATLKVQPLAPGRWQAIKQSCAGKIDTLVELVQGRLADSVMRVITDRDQGLFPTPNEISLDCSCPDWAGLCKHLAAVLYGVGARLDTQPELLFLLRGVDHLELLEQAAAGGALVTSGNAGPGLADAELAEVFGIEIAPAISTSKPKPSSLRPVKVMPPPPLPTPVKVTPTPPSPSPEPRKVFVVVRKEDRQKFIKGKLFKNTPSPNNPGPPAKRARRKTGKG